MSALPFALAALLLIWLSLTGEESKMIALDALTLPFIAAIVLGFLWRYIGLDKCKTVRARWVNSAIVLISIIVFISVPATHWPLKATFKFARPSFEDVAQSLEAGRTFEHPFRVGFLTIKKAEIYDMNGKICLWTDLHPSGKTGFTRCPPNDVPFNLWSMIELDGNWQYVSED